MTVIFSSGLYAQIVLLCFFVLFLLILLKVFFFSDKNELEKHRFIPLHKNCEREEW